jgi:predicted phage terminase large subunit-like protein
MATDSLLRTDGEADYVAKAAADDVLLYAQFCDPQYTYSPLAAGIAWQLDRLGKDIRRLVISVPPRHGKSRLCSVEWTSWMMGRRPGVEIVLASYSGDLAKEHSRRARERVRTRQWRTVFPDVTEDTEQAAAANWKLTNGSSFQAVGVGGSLTGRGADILIVDDPIKDYAEAHSATQRQRVWDWFMSVAMTRLSPGGIVVIIMTRWHVDDLVGRLLDPTRQAELREDGGETEVWHQYKLPALAEENDPLKRHPGEALFPDRFPASDLESKRRSLGPYVFGSLYQQNPVPAQGNVVDRNAFRIVDGNAIPTDRTFMRYWDLAASESDVGNFWAGAKGCIGSDGTFYITNIERWRKPWGGAKEAIIDHAINDGVPVGVEAVGGFKIAFQELRNSLPPTVMIREYGADTDKLTRALPWFALVGNGKVALLRGAWNEDFLAEVHAFPMGAFDDQVDAVSGLYIMLTQSFGTPWVLPPKRGAMGETSRAMRRLH